MTSGFCNTNRIFYQIQCVGIRAEIIRQIRKKINSNILLFKKKLIISYFILRMVRWKAILSGH